MRFSSRYFFWFYIYVTFYQGIRKLIFVVYVTEVETLTITTCK